MSTEFGAIWSLEAERGGSRIPLLRRPAANAPSVATAAGCSLIPFGNRVRGNHFRYNGRDSIGAEHRFEGPALPSWRGLVGRVAGGTGDAKFDYDAVRKPGGGSKSLRI